MRKILLIIIWVIRKNKFKSVDSYHELLKIAKWEIKTLKKFLGGKVIIVSSPLFSGGYGDLNRNILALGMVISAYGKRRGYIVWSQIPYLDINVLHTAKMDFVSDYTKKMEQFYVPLIQSGLLDGLVEVCFPEKMRIKNGDSAGCDLEKRVATEAGIEISKYHIYDDSI